MTTAEELSEIVVPRPVSDEESLRQLVSDLLDEPEYAVDTEFHRERSYYARLLLVQIAWPGGIAIVDPLAVDPAPLAKVLEGPGLAVLHAADQDLEVLERCCGAVPSRIYDTQLSAGFMGYSSPSLVHLVDRVLDRKLQKGDQLADWTRRPLPDSQLDYAAADVAHLLELRVALDERLTELGRVEWASEECERLRARDRTPPPLDEAWWKIRHARQLRSKSRSVAQTVAAWRERKARERDIPARFVLADLPLMAIAQRPPRSKKELQSIRGIDVRQVAGPVGDELMTAIDEGWELDEEAVRMPPIEVLDHVVKPAVSIATAWVAQRAGELEIDPAILGSRADVVSFLQQRPGSRLSTGWRHEILGEPLRRLAEGQASLAFDGRDNLVLEERSGVPLDLDQPRPSTSADSGAIVPSQVAAAAE
jgi:ribonuclease D